MFMGNGSPENGGCEAITKGTVEIIKQTIGDVEFIDSFFDYSGKYKKDVNHNIYPVPYPKRFSFKWFILQITTRCSVFLTNVILFSKHKYYIKKADAILSLGGDNYSLDYGVPTRFICMGKYVKKFQKKFIIWGASIGPFRDNPSFEKKMIKHLKEDVDLILLRESESKKYLDTIGIAENVKLVADPAFMMQPEQSQWYDENIIGKYICLNFSDLMAKYVTKNDMSKWIHICQSIIVDLLTEYNSNIILIPHVKTDSEFMKLIIANIQSDRIILAPTYLNAAQMKWIISKAECNIACRTHSTIASFSTSVPTLSLGYSLKSKGLNKQMYGHEKYLLYCNDITRENFRIVFHELWENREEIHKQLKTMNITIRATALDAGIYLKQLLEK